MKKHAVFIIKNSDNKILFVQRAFTKKTLPGAWAFPSGKVEEGEDVNEAIVREGLEELGVILNPIKSLVTKELEEFSALLDFVLCDIKEGVPFIKEPDEIEKIEWMALDDFFKRFSDDEIGHGLVWLRKNRHLLGDLFS